MTQNTPLSPCPLPHSAEPRRRVLSAAQLKALGVSPAQLAARCRTGGGWQQPLPGVYVLHPGAPTPDERLRAALLYAGRHSGADAAGGGDGFGEAMLTGAAALALLGFSTVPPAGTTERIDVLVPRARRLRSARYVHLVRGTEPPRAEWVGGLPVAPAARALVDTVAGLGDIRDVRRLLGEAVRGGHGEPADLIRGLEGAGLMARPLLRDAADALLAEGRALAEGALYDMVRTYGLPEPLWNVDLRLSAGPHLGGVDAYWPEEAVAVELDTHGLRTGRIGEPRRERDAHWFACAARREHLERLGVTVVHLSGHELRGAGERQAAVVRTALLAAADREPAAYVVILPR